MNNEIIQNHNLLYSEHNIILISKRMNYYQELRSKNEI